MQAPKNAGIAKRTATSSSQAPAAKPRNFATYVKQPNVLSSIEKTLGTASKRETFVAALISAVTANKGLQECDPSTIISAALLGESLQLPPSPQLGYFYMVPFNAKAKKLADGTWLPARKEAQFILGYKGLIQLAQRAGVFRRINVTSVKEGELIRWDPFTEDLEYDLKANRNSLKTIGYYAFFELTNGFRKAAYMSYDDMVDYADQFSKAFDKGDYERLKAGQIPQSEAWKYSSFWYKNFDAMAYKTMLRQLISKWAPMSVEIVKAIDSDMAADKTLPMDDADVVDVDFSVSDPDQNPEIIDGDTGEIIDINDQTETM